MRELLDTTIVIFLSVASGYLFSLVQTQIRVKPTPHQIFLFIVSKFVFLYLWNILFFLIFPISFFFFRFDFGKFLVNNCTTCVNHETKHNIQEKHIGEYEKWDEINIVPMRKIHSESVDFIIPAPSILLNHEQSQERVVIVIEIEKHIVLIDLITINFFVELWGARIDISSKHRNSYCGVNKEENHSYEKNITEITETIKNTFNMRFDILV